jgi:hypothetical protein
MPLGIQSMRSLPGFGLIVRLAVTAAHRHALPGKSAMAGETVNTTRLELLKKEIDIVQEGIARYGDVQFKIKGWAITIFSAFVIFALEHKQPVMLLACGVTVLLFWALDAFYKSLQSVYICQARRIENLVNSCYLEGVQSSGEKRIFCLESKLHEWEQRSLWKNFGECGRLPQISLIYLVMLAALIFLYALQLTEYSPWVLTAER